MVNDSRFLDYPSGRSTFGRLQGKKTERKEGSKDMRRYTLLTDISPLKSLCLGGTPYRNLLTNQNLLNIE